MHLPELKTCGNFWHGVCRTNCGLNGGSHENPSSHIGLNYSPSYKSDAAGTGRARGAFRPTWPCRSAVRKTGVRLRARTAAALGTNIPVRASINCSNAYTWSNRWNASARSLTSPVATCIELVTRYLACEPFVQSALKKVPAEYKAACYAKRQEYDGAALRTRLRFQILQSLAGSYKNTWPRGIPASRRSAGNDKRIAFPWKSDNKICNQPDDWRNEQHDQ